VKNNLKDIEDYENEYGVVEIKLTSKCKI